MPATEVTHEWRAKAVHSALCRAEAWLDMPLAPAGPVADRIDAILQVAQKRPLRPLRLYSLVWTLAQHLERMPVY